MQGIRFEWDEAKNLANLRKHGISFEDASQAFLDPLIVSVKERVVEGEQRWQTLGRIDGWLIVMVAHTVVEEGPHGVSTDVIRMISARYASRRERQRYEDENG